MEAAIKFLKPLQTLASKRIETHNLAFEIYLRKGMCEVCWLCVSFILTISYYLHTNVFPSNVCHSNKKIDIPKIKNY